jgi:hypothetical protein
MHNVTLTRVRVPLLPWKAIIITYSEVFFVAVGIQHAMRMRIILLSSVACLAVSHLSTLPHNRQEF